MTRTVSVHTRRADAVFVAVGRPKLIDASMIKPGAAVIDIGINTVIGPDGKETIVGDVNYDAVKEEAAWITPVPGGVGPVTVSILLRNTVTALRRQKAVYESAFGSDDPAP
jgi:methylenetetrahydrofolate dehydrogenase (NADP+)/methenyltetrahydrofolate cyclohydrolase